MVDLVLLQKQNHRQRVGSRYLVQDNVNLQQILFYLRVKYRNTRVILMGKLQKDKAGFSAVEVIVALIGAIGWFVDNNQHKKTTTPVANTTSTKPAATTPAKTPTPAPHTTPS